MPRANPIDAFLIGYVWGRVEEGQHAIDLASLIADCPMYPSEKTAMDSAVSKDRTTLRAWMLEQKQDPPEFGDSVFESIVKDRVYKQKLKQAIALITTLPDMERLCDVDATLSQAERALMVVQELKALRCTATT